LSGPSALPTPPAAVLFDLDDTLYPERQFVDGGFRAVAGFLAGRMGRPAPALAERLWELHRRDGRGRLFNTLLTEIGLGDDADLVLACLMVYRSHRPSLEPFEGAEVAIADLGDAGVRTGVVSDGHAAVQRRKLEGLGGLANRFDVVVMTDELGAAHAKPSPVPFRVACRVLDVATDRSIYVANDPRKDFRGAREAGLATIRMGPLPDEGGAVDIAALGGDDSDLSVGSFEDLTRVLLGSGATPQARKTKA
jgi:putative hydrolase of the HAD superfamily